MSETAVKKQPMGRFVYIIITCLMSVLVTMGALFNCMGVFIVVMAPTFGVGITGTSLMVTIAALVMGLTMPVWGKLTDKWSMKRIAVTATAVLVAAELLMSASVNLPMLYVAGAIFGFAIGFHCWLVIPTMINCWFKKRSGFWIGFCVMFGNLGASLFSVLDTTLNTAAGWQVTVRVIALVTLVVLIPLYLGMKERPSDVGLVPYGTEVGGSAGTADGEAAAEPEDIEKQGVPAAIAHKHASFYILIVFALLSNVLGGVYHLLPSYAATLPAAASAAMLGAWLLSASAASTAIGNVLLGFLNDRSYKLALTVAGVIGVIAILGYLFGAASIAVILIAGFLGGFWFASCGVELPIVTKAVVGLKDYSKLFSQIILVSVIFGAFGVTFWSAILTSFGGTVMWTVALAVTVLILVFGFAAIASGARLQEKVKKEQGDK